MARLSSLYRLQEADEALNHNRGRMEEIDEILSSDESIRAASEALETAQDRLVSARSAAGEADKAVSFQTDKMEKTQQALYGGSVQNPKELEELQLESESLQRYMVTLEDRLLEAMISLEQAEEAYHAAKEGMEQAQSDAASRNENLGDERKQLSADVERLKAEREAALASLGDTDLEAYQRVRKKVGKLPLAVVDDGACGVCGLAVSALKLQTVRKGDELAYCRQCGRILYGG